MREGERKRFRVKDTLPDLPPPNQEMLFHTNINPLSSQLLLMSLLLSRSRRRGQKQVDHICDWAVDMCVGFFFFFSAVLGCSLVRQRRA